MKLGEALTLRKDVVTRFKETVNRISVNTVFEKDTVPTLDSVELAREANALLEQELDLITRINRTNSAHGIADMIARRDFLKKSMDFNNGVAALAKPKRERNYGDGTVVEYVSALSSKRFTDAKDALSKEFRELDTKLQELNWTVDLLD